MIDDQAAEAAKHRAGVLRRIIRELAQQAAFEDHQAATGGRTDGQLVQILHKFPNETKE